MYQALGNAAKPLFALDLCYPLFGHQSLFRRVRPARRLFRICRRNKRTSRPNPSFRWPIARPWPTISLQSPRADALALRK